MNTVIPVTLGDITFGGERPFVLIAGPCVIESESHAADLAASLVDITRRLGVPFVFKASYDKANRTSGRSFRGPGLDEGLISIEAGRRGRRYVVGRAERGHPGNVEAEARQKCDAAHSRGESASPRAGRDREGAPQDGARAEEARRCCFERTRSEGGLRPARPPRGRSPEPASDAAERRSQGEACDRCAQAPQAPIRSVERGARCGHGPGQLDPRSADRKYSVSRLTSATVPPSGVVATAKADPR